MNEVNEMLIINGKTPNDINRQIDNFRVEMKGVPILQRETLPTDDGYVCAVGFHLTEELREQYLEYKMKMKKRQFLEEYMSYKEELNVD